MKVAIISSFLSVASAHAITLRQTSTFGYSGARAPNHWAELDPAWSACRLGDQRQSPLVVGANTPFANRANIVPNIPNVAGADIENRGFDLEITGIPGNLTRGGLVYTFLNYHFHTPSEHRIGDLYFPVEAHFVFTNEQRDLKTVVGIPIEIATGNQQQNAFLTNTFVNINSVRNPDQHARTGSLNFNLIRDHIAQFDLYNYFGSLTTPPCTQNVNWLVSSRPIYISAATYVNLKSIMKFNSRTALNVYDPNVNAPRVQ